MNRSAGVTLLGATVFWAISTSAFAQAPVQARSAETCADLAPGDAAPVVQRPDVRVGDTWTYRNQQVRSGALNRTWTETAVAADDSGVLLRRIDRVPPGNAERPPYEYKSDYGKAGLDFPLSKGKRWEGEIVRDGSRSDKIGYEVLGCEVVRTDAGDFATLKLKSDFTYESKVQRTLLWFSPTVRRVVRMVYLDHGKASQATELTAFTLSKP